MFIIGILHRYFNQDVYHLNTDIYLVNTKAVFNCDETIVCLFVLS